MQNSILTYSSLESKRFDFNIYRGSAPNLDIRALKEIIVQEQVDVAILRIPAEQNSSLHQLDKLGFPYLVADTLVYYSADLEAYHTAAYRNDDLCFVLANEADRVVLNGLVDVIFANYTNHYASNPYFKEDLIRAGYQEWVLSYLNSADKMVWFVVRNGENIGFASCSFDSATNVCEGVLYGVLPSQAGGGVYTDIIKFTKNYFKAKGFKTMLVSTQIQNYAVQKVWGREGFSIKNAYTTIHINAMLGFNCMPCYEEQICLTEADIQNIGDASGDFNPLHFDLDFAQKAGFDNVIVHGFYFDQKLTNYFGMISPGQGSIYTGSKYVFFAPLYPNYTYRLVISFTLIHQQKGIYKSVAKIFDGTKICQIAYSDLIKR